MDDDNDYGNNYFDDGGNYLDEDDNLDDGPTYQHFIKFCNKKNIQILQASMFHSHLNIQPKRVD